MDLGSPWSLKSKIITALVMGIVFLTFYWIVTKFNIPEKHQPYSLIGFFGLLLIIFLFLWFQKK
jgi:hypothetical protein